MGHNIRIRPVFGGQIQRLIDYRSFSFSGGEIQVRLDLEEKITPLAFDLEADLRSPADIIELMLVTNAIRHAFPGVDLSLLCPYLPYARQDRVCVAGEAFSLEVICAMLNILEFDRISLWDVHSEVSLRLLNNSSNEPAAVLIPRSIIGDAILVAPDKGAIPRVEFCAGLFDRPMIRAEKVRNPDTGEITHTEVHLDDVDCAGRDFFIIDDICDGGRTFIELAQVLRPLTTGKIKLWVTHGIFSQGFEVFKGLIDEIYTANCFQETVPSFVRVVHN
jgi:ribose-phosphate pyrophosphokinase